MKKLLALSLLATSAAFAQVPATPTTASAPAVTQKVSPATAEKKVAKKHVHKKHHRHAHKKAAAKA